VFVDHLPNRLDRCTVHDDKLLYIQHFQHMDFPPNMDFDIYCWYKLYLSHSLRLQHIQLW
jgi:hypothetical protein